MKQASSLSIFLVLFSFFLSSANAESVMDYLKTDILPYTDCRILGTSAIVGYTDKTSTPHPFVISLENDKDSAVQDPDFYLACQVEYGTPTPFRYAIPIQLSTLQSKASFKTNSNRHLNLLLSGLHGKEFGQIFGSYRDGSYHPTYRVNKEKHREIPRYSSPTVTFINEHHIQLTVADITPSLWSTQSEITASALSISPGNSSNKALWLTSTYDTPSNRSYFPKYIANEGTRDEEYTIIDLDDPELNKKKFFQYRLGLENQRESLSEKHYQSLKEKRTPVLISTLKSLDIPKDLNTLFKDYDSVTLNTSNGGYYLAVTDTQAKLEYWCNNYGLCWLAKKDYVFDCRSAIQFCSSFSVTTDFGTQVQGRLPQDHELRQVKRDLAEFELSFLTHLLFPNKKKTVLTYSGDQTQGCRFRDQEVGFSPHFYPTSCVFEISESPEVVQLHLLKE